VCVCVCVCVCGGDWGLEFSSYVILMIPWLLVLFSFFTLASFKKNIGIWLIYNVALVSGIQPSDSVIQIYKYIFFLVLFHYRFL